MILSCVGRVSALIVSLRRSFEWSPPLSRHGTAAVVYALAPAPM
ncbi:hypothetical protein HMPREF0970_01532 [Schaalia odontolytica F0309]|uniref:Uncharacterized protein n=1 Tax=Schaalia odontolytica F0309 TaxID=649742 RepID=D4TZZ6_9ACTO|nr:hypothetical protein HMPREF0970_01532 [Schaalia odontolytica F0309]